MGSIWLTGSDPRYPNLGDVVRSTGLRTELWPGWESMSRSSGGFTYLRGIVVHHTASPAGTSWDSDWSFCAVGHQDAPVASLLLGRDGRVGVHAGGAANHAGQGGPWTTSSGVVPIDSGNSQLLGIEAANNGVGEAWPAAQVDAYLRLCAALCAAYRFDPLRDVLAHFEWAPARKIDPWGGSSPTPGFPFTGARSWDMPAFRAAIGGAPSDEGEALLYVLVPKGAWVQPDHAWLARYSSGRLSYCSSADVEWATGHNVPQVAVESPDQYNNLLATSDANGITPPARV